jgi:nucleosome binding factor SPN SPT16 subunit
LIINPSEQIKKAYIFLFDLSQHPSSLSKGTPLSTVHSKCKSSAFNKDPELAKLLPVSFGYGSKGKIINENSKESLQPGEVFTFTWSLNVNNGKNNREANLVLFDSFFVPEIGNLKTLTDVVKEFQDISYSLEDEEKIATKIDIKELENKGVLRSSRFRHQINSEQIEKDKKRKERQIELRYEKIEELKQRFSGFDGNSRRGTTTQKSLAEVTAYSSRENFPEAARKNQIFVDTRHESVLLPIHGQLVPFHVSTIKNVSKNEEGRLFFLRINFLHPGGGIVKDSKYILPDLTHPNNFYIKELTFRSSNPRNLNNSFKTLKELIKKVKANEMEEKEKGSLIDQEKLILIKGKRPSLPDVTIRPNISGKKTQGSLEGHQNGIRFTSNKGDKVDVIYANIKHAIFQPVENELIVLIHFRLRNSIMIGTKKTIDVQFYTEAGIQSDDLDLRRRAGMDLDEIQAEQRERKFKEKLNKEFKNFIESVQTISNETIDFDIPYRELGFHGVPFKSSVFIMPSVNCLVSLIENPFFVVTLNDIEVAHFERVQFNLKNFDLVLIFKDYSVNPLRICTIPAEFLDPIKDWLNDIDIVYSESLNPLNWGNVMKEITKDLNNFIEEGACNFLQESDDEESQGQDDASINEDSVFSSADAENSGISESEYSDESEEAEESGSQEDLESDEDSGLEWEELEIQAKKADAKKREKQVKEAKPVKKIRK